MAVGNTVCEETQSHMDMNAVWKIEGRKSADGVWSMEYMKAAVCGDGRECVSKSTCIVKKQLR